MTTAKDSAIPNSQPSNYIMATTEMTMIDMQRMENMEMRMFKVEILRMRKANNNERTIPCLAVIKNSLSVLIQVKYFPPVMMP